MRIKPTPTRPPSRTQHSDFYREYLESPAWAVTRAAALARAGHRCEQWTGNAWRCAATVGLEVHHRSYDHLGSEPWSDLVVLCAPHHRDADRRRQHARRQR